MTNLLIHVALFFFISSLSAQCSTHSPRHKPSLSLLRNLEPSKPKAKTVGKKASKRRLSDSSLDDESQLALLSSRSPETTTIRPKWVPTEKYEGLAKSYDALNILLALSDPELISDISGKKNLNWILHAVQDAHANLGERSSKQDTFKYLSAINSFLYGISNSRRTKSERAFNQLYELMRCDGVEDEDSLITFMLILSFLDPVLSGDHKTISREDFMQTLPITLSFASAKVVTDMYFVDDKDEADKRARDAICGYAVGIAQSSDTKSAIACAEEIIKALKLLPIFEPA